MRKLIAGLVAGLILGISGTAVAATSNYWHGKGSGYDCEGTTSGFICKSGGFSLGATKSFVFLQKGRAGGNGPVMACDKWGSWYSCDQG